MPKKLLVISTSLRTGSNSDILAGQFAAGATAAGAAVSRISLVGKNIAFCTGCLACQKTGACVLQDDVAAILEQVKNADAVAFATPIYYYEMCGQMKTLLDRLNPLYGTNYNFRDVYLLATAAEDDAAAFARAENGLGGWVACFEKAHLAGTVYGGGINAPRAALQNEKAMQASYALGLAAGK